VQSRRLVWQWHWHPSGRGLLLRVFALSLYFNAALGAFAERTLAA
jgi:hypothetical protein